MKHILSILLFCLIFENVFSSHKNFARMIQKLKANKLSKSKANKLRNLQTDISDDGETNGTYVPPPSESYTQTPDDQPETGNATANNSFVPATKPVSQKGRKIGNKKAQIQIMKFHSFNIEGKKISFASFFYFISRIIPYSIIFRLRVTYASRLRNLQEAQAESVRTDCIIGSDLSGESADSTGKNVNYKCEATTTNDPSNAKIELNTDFDMILVDKNGNVEDPVNFNDVNFDEKAAEEAQNIQNCKTELDGSIITLTVTSADIVDKHILQFVGTLDETTLRRLSLSEGKNDVTLNLVPNSNSPNETKDYTCTLNKESTTGTLECDTSSQPIDTTAGEQHLKNGYSGSSFFSVNTEKVSSKALKTDQSSDYKYSKSSSSGLSGGAIAGIVIACVAVLVAASVAAIMLRKPSTPAIDSSTTAVANLGTDNV